MNLSVRKADLEVDKHVIIETLFHYLTADSNEERFNWLYTKNPFGPAELGLGSIKKMVLILGWQVRFLVVRILMEKLKTVGCLGIFVSTNNTVALVPPSNSSGRVLLTLTLKIPECGTIFLVRV